MAEHRDRDKSRLMDALNEAEHCALASEQLKTLDSPVARELGIQAELYFLNRAHAVDHLLDALEALELGVQGRPTVEALEKAMAYYPLDVRIIVTLLPPGAAMKRNR